METSLDLIARYRQLPQLAAHADQFEQARVARLYVGDHRSDAHLVKSYDRASKQWLAAIYSVELSLDKRQLIAATQLAAPQLIGRVFAYDDRRHPYAVWGVEAWLSAAAHIAALEVTKGVA